MKKALPILAALAAALCHSYPARAAHPLVTEDTGTQDKGGWQIETNSDHLAYRSQASGTVAAWTLTYGAADGVDLMIGQTLFRAPNAGAGDLVLGMKWRAWDNGGTQLGLKTEVSLPTGNAERGLGYGRANGTLTGLWAAAHGDWTLLANIAVASNYLRQPAGEASNREWLWRTSGAALYRLDKQWRVALDAGMRRNPVAQDSRLPAYGLLGVIYMPREDMDLDIGARFGLTRAEVQRQFGAGFTARF